MLVVVADVDVGAAAVGTVVADVGSVVDSDIVVVADSDVVADAVVEEGK